MKVHVAGNIIVSPEISEDVEEDHPMLIHPPGGVPDGAVIVHPYGGWLGVEGGAPQGLCLVNKQIWHPEQ